MKKMILSILAFAVNIAFADVAVLPPDVAFPHKINCGKTICTITITPQKGYYVYSDIELKYEGNSVRTNLYGEITYIQDKKAYAQMQIVFDNPYTWNKASMKDRLGSIKQTDTVELVYHGCNEAFFCYSKMKKVIKVTP